MLPLGGIVKVMVILVSHCEVIKVQSWSMEGFTDSSKVRWEGCGCMVAVFPSIG
jgi:hypothetical protein